jgi:hypothetical protein
MKPKTAMYAALGFATYRFGKLYAKRKGKRTLKSWAASR